MCVCGGDELRVTPAASLSLFSSTQSVAHTMMVISLRPIDTMYSSSQRNFTFTTYSRTRHGAQLTRPPPVLSSRARTLAPSPPLPQHAGPRGHGLCVTCEVCAWYFLNAVSVETMG